MEDDDNLDAWGNAGEMVDCMSCGGIGTEYGETCVTCGGFGWINEPFDAGDDAMTEHYMGFQSVTEAETERAAIERANPDARVWAKGGAL